MVIGLIVLAAAVLIGAAGIIGVKLGGGNRGADRSIEQFVVSQQTTTSSRFILSTAVLRSALSSLRPSISMSWMLLSWMSCRNSGIPAIAQTMK